MDWLIDWLSDSDKKTVALGALAVTGAAVVGVAICCRSKSIVGAGSIQAAIDKHPIGAKKGEVEESLRPLGAFFVPWLDGTLSTTHAYKD